MGTKRYGVHQALVDTLGAWGDLLYILTAGGVAIAISGSAAYLASQPLLFPSLGPTVLLFFEQPMAQGSSPRNALLGHGVALIVGYVSIVIFGLVATPNVLEAGVTPQRIGAAALSVALTGAITLLLRSSHPPAGATTLLVSLGLLATPEDLVVLALGVTFLTATSWLINRALGVPVPTWSQVGPKTS